MNTTQQQDQSTEAVISVVDSAFAALGPQQKAPTTLVNTVGFSYSSDVLQLGDAFSVSVPNPRGQYTDKFIRGQTVQLFLRNPNVGGNAQTLKHLGIIVKRKQSVSQGGSVIQLDCADLGWHLINNTAPLYYRLQYAKLYTLLTDPKWIDPSWGFRGVAADNKTNRLIRLNVNNGRAQAAIDAQAALGTLTYIQVEPGDKIADLINQYARRIGRLMNVSCDGYIQIWRPDFSQEALYRIEFHGFDEQNRNLNQVLDMFIEEDISTIFTHTTCVGEMVGGDIALDAANQNATKRRGDCKPDPAPLPFQHKFSFAEPDVFDEPDAKLQAVWLYNRGLFDSWQAVYVLRGHYQKSSDGRKANWWESDTMCSVNDTVNGLSGNFYVSSVRCDRDEKGDRTTVTLRKPVLQASFGVFQRPPRIKGSIVDSPGTPTASSTTIAPPPPAGGGPST